MVPRCVSSYIYDEVSLGEEDECVRLHHRLLHQRWEGVQLETGSVIGPRVVLEDEWWCTPMSEYGQISLSVGEGW